MGEGKSTVQGWSCDHLELPFPWLKGLIFMKFVLSSISTKVYFFVLAYLSLYIFHYSILKSFWNPTYPIFRSSLFIKVLKVFLAFMRNMIQLMVLYGFPCSGYDIHSKYRSNKAWILIFIRRALVWGVDFSHLLGYTHRHLNLGGGWGWNNGVVRFILEVLLSDPQKKCKIQFFMVKWQVFDSQTFC